MPITISGNGDITGLPTGWLPDGIVTTADLADGAVTTAKIASGAVVEADLANGAVTPTKLSQSYLPLTGGTLSGTVIGPANSQMGNWQFAGNDLNSRYNNSGSWRRSLVVGASNELVINYQADHPRVYMGGGLQIDGNFSYTVCNYGYLSTGTGYFSGCQTIAAGLFVPNGRIVAPEINCTSDRRLKYNIDEISEDAALAFALNVKPVSFQWIEGHPAHSEGQRIGYIAQDVAAAGFPNLVAFSPASEAACAEHEPVDPVTGVENPQDAFFTLNYDDAAVLTHRALQVALKRIEQLEARIAALEVTP